MLSFIIPVYNCENYLPRCLDSILSTNGDYEIILINDGSKDNSLAVCESYKKKYNFITIIDQVNKGTSGARNAGLDIAKGDYIWFVDSDDRIQNRILDKVFKHLESKADVYCFNHSDDNYNGVTDTVLFNAEETISGLGYLSLHTSMYLWDKLFQRSTIGNIRFLEGIRNTEDMLFTLQVMLEANIVKLCKDNIYVYNQTNPCSTLSNRKLASLLKNSYDTLTVHRAMVEIIKKSDNTECKNELNCHLNFNICGHLFSFFNDRMPESHINEIIDQYKGLGLYPIKRCNNKKANMFRFLANRKWLFNFTINTLRRIKGPRYVV